MTPMMPSVRSNQVSSAQAVPTGDSTVQLKAEVQFLNNQKDQPDLRNSSW